MKHLLLLVILVMPLGVNAEYPLETIELKGRSLEEVLPLIRQFLDKNGVASGMNNQLVIRTSPKNLFEIKALLQRIDRPPRRLMISVRQRATTETGQSSITLEAPAHVVDSTRLIAGSPSKKPGVRMQGLQGSTSRDTTNVSRIQTIEGSSAFIAIGRSLPVTTGQLLADGIVRTYHSTTGYRDATTGFYAQPRTNGDRVTIDISPFMTQPSTLRGSFDIANVASRISGRLGEWIEIGGIAQYGDDIGRGIGLHATTETADIQGFEIMVDVLP